MKGLVYRDEWINLLWKVWYETKTTISSAEWERSSRRLTHSEKHTEDSYHVAPLLIFISRVYPYSSHATHSIPTHLVLLLVSFQRMVRMIWSVQLRRANIAFKLRTKGRRLVLTRSKCIFFRLELFLFWAFCIRGWVRGRGLLYSWRILFWNSQFHILSVELPPVST